MDNVDITFLTFAWETLTEHQQYRIEMRYVLKCKLENLTDGDTKRSCYNIIASEFPGYSVSTIEYIANHELKNNGNS